MDLTNTVDDFFGFSNNLVEWGDVGTTYERLLFEVTNVEVKESQEGTPYMNLTMVVRGGDEDGLTLWKKLFRHNQGSLKFSRMFFNRLGLDPNTSSLEDMKGCFMYADVEVRQNDPAYDPQPEITKMYKADDIDAASLV